jgi:two-component system phosphate regulon response regulator OmpR
MEFEILSLFIKNINTVLTRDQILDHLRGMDWESFDRSIDVLVSRLRNKLGDDPKTPNFIKTVWGSGYMFIAKKVEDL